MLKNTLILALAIFSSVVLAEKEPSSELAAIQTYFTKAVTPAKADEVHFLSLYPRTYSVTPHYIATQVLQDEAEAIHSNENELKMFNLYDLDASPRKEATITQRIFGLKAGLPGFCARLKASHRFECKIKTRKLLDFASAHANITYVLERETDGGLTDVLVFINDRRDFHQYLVLEFAI